MALLFASIAFARSWKAQELLQQKITLDIKQQPLLKSSARIENLVDVKFLYSSSLHPVRSRVGVDLQADNETLGIRPHRIISAIVTAIPGLRRQIV